MALAAEQLVLEEVVVTAQKRQQAITDVPITISAYDGEFLKKLDIDRYDELGDITPGLNVQQQSINNNGYVIRGITSDAGEATHAARVSIYLNGVDVSRSRASYFEIYDMERIEVVKGPQPTLFGTASSVGAINFITNKPVQEFEAEIGGGIGNLGMFTLDGMINNGNSLVQGRFAFKMKDRDGYIKNNSDEADLHGYDRLSYRPSLRITPTESLTIDLIYMHDEAEDSGTAFVARDLLFTDNAWLSVPVSSNLGDDKTGVDREVDDFNITVNWDINDLLSLSYIGATRDYESLEVFDADGIAIEFLSFSEKATGDQESHELRLNIGSDVFNGFIGASYFEENAQQLVNFAGDEIQVLGCAGFHPVGCNPLPAGTTRYAYEANYKNGAVNRSTSIFFDGSVPLSSVLELTFGVRWTDQTRSASYRSVLPNSQFLAGLNINTDLFIGRAHNSQGETLRGRISETVVLPRISLRWDVTDESSAYFTVSKGQRPTVVEVSEGEEEIIEPEKVINYEIGLKGNVLDNALSYNVSVFHQEYNDFRVSILNDAGNYVPANAGEATNSGVEMEAKWQANEMLTVFGSAAYIDAEVEASAENARYAGNRFRLQPEYSGALGYMLDMPLSDGLKLISRGTVTYRSQVYFNIANTYEQGSVSLAKLKLGVSDINDTWEVEVFGNNLFDKEYIIDAGNTGSSFGYPTFIEGAPRTYGIQGRYRF
jgi:outer membrane receptor protein involved in Fe transport